MQLQRVSVAAAFAIPWVIFASCAKAGNHEFSLSLTPYAWFPGLEGTVGARGFEADVDKSFVDIFEASDDLFGVLLRAEGSYGRFGFYADGGYMQIGVDDASGRFGLGEVDVVQRLGLVDFGLMYRFLDHREEDRQVAVDVTAGARFWNVELELDPASLSGRTATKDWILPTIGLRGTIGLGRRWEIALGGDVGGFGAGSDFSWSATGTLGYSFNLGTVESSIFAGYRAVAEEFEAGPVSFDATLHGPVIGWRFRF